MSFVEGGGRFGNQVIRYLATSFLAKAHNLKVEYSSSSGTVDRLKALGIELWSGERAYPSTYPVTEDTYFSVLNAPHFGMNIDLNSQYYQTEPITNLIQTYLDSPEQKEAIRAANPFRERYGTNEDVFVHLRLDDTQIWALPLQYYIDCIRSVSFSTLYLSTDSPDHAYLHAIKEAYPSAVLLSYDEVKTMQFGSTCKTVILSHGSFSAVIGYLSFDSTVYYRNAPVPWAPLGLFSGKGWIGIDPA